MTLEEYLESEMANGAIDHALRVERDGNGKMRFYIHPAYQGGSTVDFFVDGNNLGPIK
jgi:hypothetical protein